MNVKTEEIKSEQADVIRETVWYTYINRLITLVKVSYIITNY